MIAGVFGVGVYFDAVGFLNRQAQLKRVDRVQPQAFAKQGLLVADVADADVFEAQGIDDQLFNVAFQIAHLWRAP